jgi:exopolysaccharide production protein ExoQ
MPRVVALLLCIAFILWLFAVERKRRTGVSAALWIPILWVLIIASRPVSQWLHPGAPEVTVGTELEGSPIDRAFYFGIIIAGFLVLTRRRLDWGRVISENPWVFLFYAYFALTILWSPYPLVSLKRLFKDFGNVVMILVVLTESNPLAAVKSLLSRCTYVFLPMSFLFIQYYPELGRGYTPFTWEPYFTGVTTGKNTLGELLIICGLFIVWRAPAGWIRNLRRTPRPEIIAWVVILFMECWLLWKAHSSTALGCFLFGGIILLVMRMPFCQRRTRHLGVYGVLIVGAVLVLNTLFNLGQFFAESLGRDTTLTGRTEIWDRVLHSQTNQIFGEGFWIFWDTDKSADLFPDFFFRLLQAHNGYIELYLDGGLVGVLVLVIFTVSCLRKAKKDILKGNSLGVLYLLFALAALVHNYTEASFARLTFIWFALLLAGMQIPFRRTSERAARATARSGSPVAEVA